MLYMNLGNELMGDKIAVPLGVKILLCYLILENNYRQIKVAKIIERDREKDAPSYVGVYERQDCIVTCVNMFL